MSLVSRGALFIMIQLGGLAVTMSVVALLGAGPGAAVIISLMGGSVTMLVALDRTVYR